MWWTAPAPGDESPECHRSYHPHQGAVPHADYHNRFGYCQERVSGPRHRCGREGRRQEAASPRSSDCLFRGTAALPHWHGGLCYWARELTKLGHEVRLMPAKDVKGYVKRNKNDAADAEAICEAVGRKRLSDGKMRLRRCVHELQG